MKGIPTVPGLQQGGFRAVQQTLICVHVVIYVHLSHFPQLKYIIIAQLWMRILKYTYILFDHNTIPANKAIFLFFICLIINPF